MHPSPLSTRAHPRHVRRLLLSLLAVLMLVAAPLGAATSANATTTSSADLQFSGDATLQSATVSAGCDGCIPGDSGAGVILNVAVQAHWTPTASVSYAYQSSLLRQGQSLGVDTKLTPGSGPLKITWGVSGTVGQYNFTDSSAPAFPADGSAMNVRAYDTSVTESADCPLKLAGDGTYSCQVTHTFRVLDASFDIAGFDVAGVTADLPLTTTLSITPDGVTTVRSITLGGHVVGQDSITFNGPSPALVTDTLVVPCTAQPGDDLMYDLTSSSTSPGYAATTKVNVKIDLTVLFVSTTLVDETIATWGPTSGSMTLTAGSRATSLGPVLPNNVPPTIVSPTTYLGSEGSPVQLTAAGTTSVCPAGLVYRWDLSDGGTEYGVTPQHTFADNAVYSGLLTVTDVTGLSATQAFSVTVANRAPVAKAGPDTAAVWGRPVAFNGSAVDPSSIDQNTLAYTWTFGDGTPPFASGGAATTHAYATPGSYTATLVACDKDGACSAPSSRTITVGKRSVTLSYLGDTSGTYDTAATLSASLVDQFGQPVNAGTVAFAVGSQSFGVVGTASNGVASATATVALSAGSYTSTASFAGNSLYAGASGISVFNVGIKASTLTYTGSLTGGPNKAITLSAKLVDASGKALAGKTVGFVLGAQSASAVTDANGIAATSIKLTQKNGTYTVTATYAGTAGLYAGTSTSATFKLQAK